MKIYMSGLEYQRDLSFPSTGDFWRAHVIDFR